MFTSPAVFHCYWHVSSNSSSSFAEDACAPSLYVCLCGHVFCVGLWLCEWVAWGNKMKLRVFAVALLLWSFLLDVSLICSFLSVSCCNWQTEQWGASSVTGWQHLIKSRWSWVLYHNNSINEYQVSAKPWLVWQSFFSLLFICWFSSWKVRAW